MWKCVHCETINKGGEVCRVCSSPKPGSAMPPKAGYASSLINVIKKCLGSNVSIAAMIFLAANIFLQLIGALVMANSAASIIQNKIANELFGISDLSSTIASSIVNYSVAGIIIANITTIIICVFGMICCFYARSSASDLKIPALKAIQIVEIINLIFYALEILIILISSILFIPNVPSGLQGSLILISLFIIGYLALGLIFKVFLIKSLMSLINSATYNRPKGKISTFVGVMLYIYGSISGLGTLALITISPTSALAKGCECTAYFLFAVSVFKLKNEIAKVSVKGHTMPVSEVPASYSAMSSVATVSSEPSVSDAWKKPDDLGSTSVPKSSKFKGGMGRRKYTPTDSSSTPVHSAAGKSSYSGSAFKKPDHLG